jgi:hypothetical protein
VAEATAARPARTVAVAARDMVEDECDWFERDVAKTRASMPLWFRKAKR